MTEVELPNGAIIENVPDDATDEEIKAEAIRLGLATEDDFPKSAPSYDPAEGMGTFDKLSAGFGKAIYDTGRGLGQLTGLVSQEDIEEARALDAPLMDTGAGMVGNVLGHASQFALPGAAVFGTGKTLGMVPKLLGAGANVAKAGKALINPKSLTAATGAGALYAGMQPGGIGERLGNITLGGLGGALGYGGTKLLGNVIGPQVDENADLLMRSNVDITPGMVLGESGKRFEDTMTSAPILGDVIKKTQSDAVKSFNRETWNKVLAPINKTIPDKIDPGREMIDYAYDALHGYYQGLLPKMSVTVDDQFRLTMSQIKDLVGVDTLPDELSKQYDRIINKEVWGRLTEYGKGSGETLKRIESVLGSQARSYKKSTNPDQKTLGRALEEAQRAFRDLVYRNNPKYADELKAVNRSWAMSDRVGKATESLGAEDGIFTGAQLLNAVKSRTPGRDKYDFRRGSALMQDWAEAGKGVLGQRVPDSGTPLRSANLLAGGAALTGIIDPMHLMAYGGAGLAYGTKPGQRFARGLLSSRYPWLTNLGQGISDRALLGAGIGTGGGLLAANQ